MTPPRQDFFLPECCLGGRTSHFMDASQWKSSHKWCAFQYRSLIYSNAFAPFYRETPESPLAGAANRRERLHRAKPLLGITEKSGNPIMKCMSNASLKSWNFSENLSQADAFHGTASNQKNSSRQWRRVQKTIQRNSIKIASIPFPILRGSYGDDNQAVLLAPGHRSATSSRQTPVTICRFARWYSGGTALAWLAFLLSLRHLIHSY